jgi:hypothetical protein
MDTAIGSTALINTQGDFNERSSFESEIGQRKTPEFS